MNIIDEVLRYSRIYTVENINKALSIRRKETQKLRKNAKCYPSGEKEVQPKERKVARESASTTPILTREEKLAIAKSKYPPSLVATMSEEELLRIYESVLAQ